MEWVEVTGRTLEEAKEAALDQLGVDEQDAEFEVLEEPRPGLFGRFRSEARVRARVLPTSPRPKVERRERRRRDGVRSRGEAKARPADVPGERAGSSERKGGGGRGPSRARGGAGGAAADAGRGRGGGGRREAPERGRGAEDGREEADMSEREPVDEVSLAEQGEAAKDFVEGLCAEFGLEADVTVRTLDDEAVEVAVTGDDLGVLIGPKGQTLQAVQELTRTVVQRQLSARGGRLLVDVAGYRAKRRAALEEFTRGVAAQVKESGVAKVLEPMPPPDRKVVHDAINEIEGVSTTSEGEEPNRRVVIMPDATPAGAESADELDA
jgi:spoIIIJ-associated protein